MINTELAPTSSTLLFTMAFSSFLKRKKKGERREEKNKDSSFLFGLLKRTKRGKRREGNNQNPSLGLERYEDFTLSYEDFTLHRNLHKRYPNIHRGQGNYLYAKERGGERAFLDASCGAAVSVLGHNDERVKDAIKAQMDTGISYLSAAFWKNDAVDKISKNLIEGTERKMEKVFFACSGSEAIDSAIKLSRQYFFEKEGNGSPRVNYIARDRSYHGNTMGALSLSGFKSRRKPYESILSDKVHHVSACYPYRQQDKGESDATFVAKKAAELEAKFQELGPETVVAFIAEPVVGAALGCVPCVPGYLKAMRDVCHKHGALFILDEIMCGMGKTGTLHAWQEEDVAPDIQTVAKALAAGYEAVSAMLISKKIYEVLKNGSGEFVHGFTYEAMPKQAAACLAVQQILDEEDLLNNVVKQGKYLEEMLKAKLGDHPNVGDIRGKGLFWGLEFVKDKVTKEPFDPELGVSQQIFDLAISDPYNIFIYPGGGSVDGISGDHIIISPSYRVTKEDIDDIVTKISDVIIQVFLKIQRTRE